MKLAFELGYASVDKMLDEITSKDLTEWMAHFSLEAEDRERRERASRVEARASAKMTKKGISS